MFGDDRGSKKSNHKRTALDEKELPPGRNNAEDDLVTEFVTDQKILTDRREDRKSSPRKVNSGRSSAKEHKSRDLTTTAVPSKYDNNCFHSLISLMSCLLLSSSVGNGGVKVMSVCEKVSVLLPVFLLSLFTSESSVLQVEDVDLDNEASVMPLFSHQPSFGNKKNYYYPPC